MATPSLLDDDDVLGHYFNCGSARVYASGRQKHSRESEATIDPVGEELIGKAKTLYLFNQFSHVSWIREGLSPLVYKGTPETTDVETRPKTPRIKRDDTVRGSAHGEDRRVRQAAGSVAAINGTTRAVRFARCTEEGSEQVTDHHGWTTRQHSTCAGASVVDILLSVDAPLRLVPSPQLRPSIHVVG